MTRAGKPSRWTGLCALAAVGFLVFAPSVQARDLTIVSFGGTFQDSLREVFFKPFSERTKIPFKDDSYDGGLGILRARTQSGTADWDVVDVEEGDLLGGCEEGLFEKLDWSRIGDRKEFLPGVVTPCGMGFVISGVVAAYDGDKIKSGPKTWADFFDLKKFPGKRAMHNGPVYNLEIALMADGVPEGQVYKALSTAEGVDRAFKKLATLKGNVVWWQAYAQPLQLLASGEVAMTTVFNGRVYNANKNEHKNFKIMWNQEILSYDNWVILKGSPHRDAAYKFLAFYADPKVEKNFPNHIPNGMPNRNTASLLSKDILPYMPTNPEYFSHGLKEDAAFWRENNDRLTDRFSKWVAQ